MCGQQGLPRQEEAESSALSQKDGGLSVNEDWVRGNSVLGMH